jgi:hypothetical protein
VALAAGGTAAVLLFLFYAMQIDALLRLNDGHADGWVGVYESGRPFTYPRPSRVKLIILRPLDDPGRSVRFPLSTPDAFEQIKDAVETRGEYHAAPGGANSAGPIQPRNQFLCRLRYAGLGRKVVYGFVPLASGDAAGG